MKLALCELATEGDEFVSVTLVRVGFETAGEIDESGPESLASADEESYAEFVGLQRSPNADVSGGFEMLYVGSDTAAAKSSPNRVVQLENESGLSEKLPDVVVLDPQLRDLHIRHRQFPSNQHPYALPR